MTDGEREKIASIHGGPVALGEPDPVVIAWLERLLERARTGEIQAIAGAIYIPRHDHSFNSSIHYMAGDCPLYEMLGQLEMAKHLVITRADMRIRNNVDD